MSIRYDPLLTVALGEEIRRRWMARRVSGVLFDAGRREAWITFPGGDAGPADLLGFLLHPARGYVVHETLDGPGPQPSVRFRRLVLAGVVHPPDERRLVLLFSGGSGPAPSGEPAFTLHVELHTNQWNAVLVRGSAGPIEAVLWPRSAGGRDLRRGVAYTPPEGGRAWIERAPDLQAWRTLLGDRSRPERRRTLLESAAWISSINVDWVLGREDDNPAASRERYLRVRGPVAEGAWILPTRSGAHQPYPLPLDRGDRCPDLLAAMRTAAQRAGEPPPEAPGGGSAPGVSTAGDVASEREVLLDELRGRVRRLRRRRSALERQVAGDDAASLRRTADLLLARQAEVPRGASHVRLEDFEGTTVRVDLDPRLDAIRNAARYYDRARRRERAALQLPSKLRDVSERLAAAEKTLAAVRAGAPTDEAWELVGGRPSRPARVARGASTSGERRPLPYRAYRSSSGLEIRVGRSARDNDDLTFRHASPEDIWLHARQSPGAHVVLRWGRRDQNPPRADLVEAATLAAVHSEARHSSLVAVDWTRRKHVRKPRRSAPGVVVPDRVHTLFVEPDASLAGRLARDE